MSKKGGDLQAVQRKRPFARRSNWSVNLLLACLLVGCLDSASVSSPTCLYPSTRRNAKIKIEKLRLAHIAYLKKEGLFVIIYYTTSDSSVLWEHKGE